MKRWTLMLLALAVAPASAEELTVVGWNLQANDASLGPILRQMGELGAVDLWGFANVSEKWLDKLGEAAAGGRGGKTYAWVRGNPGASREMYIFYDPDRFTLRSHCELDEAHPPTLGRRLPLVARFRRAGGSDLLFMLNHLYSTSSQIAEPERWRQAAALNAWAAEQSAPVVAVGDYNFDWQLPEDVPSRDYEVLTEGGAWRWVRPAELVPTYCREGFGVRDFVFTAGPARAWTARSEILFRDAGYCAASKNSGHRPVRATFQLP